MRGALTLSSALTNQQGLSSGVRPGRGDSPTPTMFGRENGREHSSCPLGSWLLSQEGGCTPLPRGQDTVSAPYSQGLPTLSCHAQSGRVAAKGCVPTSGGYF